MITDVRARGGDEAEAGVPFVPEVRFRHKILWWRTEGFYRVRFVDKYYPICGHHFWDNDDGATTVCKALGFSRGARWATEDKYDVDAMPVGKCKAGEPLTKCTGGGNEWGDLNGLHGWCKKGNTIGVKVICDPPGVCVGRGWVPYIDFTENYAYGDFSNVTGKPVYSIPDMCVCVCVCVC